MKSKGRIIFFSIVIIGTLLWKNNIFHTTYSYPYNLEDATLFYEEDQEELSKKIKIYLEDIDNFLISNSSFEYSDILTENYDFLTNFALDYILNYQESYYDKIKLLTNYSYINKEGIETTTNQYIPLEEIYHITDKFFGIKDYKIINPNIQIINNDISLINNTTIDFPLKIEKVSVEIKEKQVLATITYEMNNTYLYTFSNQNNVLKIRNIEVLE